MELNVRHLADAAVQRAGQEMTVPSRFVMARLLDKELALRMVCAMIQIDANARASGQVLPAKSHGALERPRSWLVVAMEVVCLQIRVSVKRVGSAINAKTQSVGFNTRLKHVPGMELAQGLMSASARAAGLATCASMLNALDLPQATIRCVTKTASVCSQIHALVVRASTERIVQPKAVEWTLQRV
jgi:hypothetical protein